MAVHFNESSVAAEEFGENAARQRLLTAARVPGTNIHLDRWTLRANAKAALTVPATSLAWFQMLEGEAAFAHADGEAALTRSHIVFLPPGFRGSLASSAGAVLLYAEVPEAGRFDPAFASNPPQLRVVDWTREPVLDSEHDARKRIYVVTPKLFGTKALKGEMIIYPPDTKAANHHHEGAEHFMYLLQGRATYANEQPMQVRAGDICYFHDRERHYFHSEGPEDMVFVEFFVPGQYNTVWAPGAKLCTWVPTGRSLSGEKPVREIGKHVFANADV
jgi:quercetin dioxygenase-like cupin family protein